MPKLTKETSKELFYKQRADIEVCLDPNTLKPRLYIFPDNWDMEVLVVDIGKVDHDRLL